MNYEEYNDEDVNDLREIIGDEDKELSLAQLLKIVKSEED